MASKNKLTDLNDLLIQTIQNIADPDEDVQGNPINQIDYQKATAIAKLGQVMVNSAKVQVDAFKLIARGQIKQEDLPEVVKTTIPYNIVISE